jgi:hypothetical protein
MSLNQHYAGYRIDLCGPFETPILDAQGRITRPDKPLKAHVVIMVDYFTKAAEFAVIYDKSAAAVAKAFYYSWICRYFVPSHVTSDNGTEFESEFEHMLARLGIHHIHTSAAHPASNGAVEHVVKSFKAMLNAHVNAHPQHWVQSIPVVRMQYWSRLHAALGMSPHEMVFGRQPRPALPLGGLVAMAAQAAPVVSVVPDDCPQPFEHVMQLQQQLLGYDADVFQKIQTQFFKNSRHWPLRVHCATAAKTSVRSLSRCALAIGCLKWFLAQCPHCMRACVVLFWLWVLLALRKKSLCCKLAAQPSRRLQCSSVMLAI